MDRQRVREIVASWVTLRTEFTTFTVLDMRRFCEAMNDRTRQLVAEYTSEHGSLDPMFWQNLSRRAELAQRVLLSQDPQQPMEPFDTIAGRKMIREWDSRDESWYSGLTELCVHAATLTAGARVIADGVDRTNV